MPVKINGSSSGSVTLAAPASGSDVTLTLPTTAIATESFATSAASSAVAPMGLVAVAPTSIANSGGSASLSDYTVSFSGVSSVSLNGVFSGDYDNYAVLIRAAKSTSAHLRVRLRASGADATGNDYYYSRMWWLSPSTDGANNQTTYLQLDNTVTGTAAVNMTIFDAAVAFHTRFSYLYGTPYANTGSGTASHTQAIAYDGFTLYPDSGTMTGTVSVYGYKS